MYRRRGSSQAPAGLLILSVVNSGDDQNFFVTLSGPPNMSGSETPGDLVIDGEPGNTVTLDAGNVVVVDTTVPVSPNGTWSLSGPLIGASPLLYPQNGSY